MRAGSIRLTFQKDAFHSLSLNDLYGLCSPGMTGKKQTFLVLFCQESSALQSKEEKGGPLSCFPPALSETCADPLFILCILRAPPTHSQYVSNWGKMRPIPPGHLLPAVTNQLQ